MQVATFPQAKHHREVSNNGSKQEQNADQTADGIRCSESVDVANSLFDVRKTKIFWFHRVALIDHEDFEMLLFNITYTGYI